MPVKRTTPARRTKPTAAASAAAATASTPPPEKDEEGQEKPRPPKARTAAARRKPAAPAPPAPETDFPVSTPAIGVGSIAAPASDSASLDARLAEYSARIDTVGADARENLHELLDLLRERFDSVVGRTQEALRELSTQGLPADIDTKALDRFVTRLSRLAQKPEVPLKDIDKLENLSRKALRKLLDV